MSNHIKRMLNASLNSSNPSISAHRNRGNIPITKQIRDLNFGGRSMTSKNSTLRPSNFNNTQKINIGEHLECMHALDEKDQNQVYADSIHHNIHGQHKSILKKNSSSNKFRLILGKNKENTCKYSYLGSTGFNKGLERALAEYKEPTHKTPSYNSRGFKKNTVKPEMIRPPGEESNPYYKTQPRKYDHEINTDDKENIMWKNMTQQDVFGKDYLKLSGVLPTSTKNSTSKYNKFNLTREHNYQEQDLELPDGLKDIDDSDLDVEDYDESPRDNTCEDLSLEENNPKCFTKSKIELFQTNNVKEN
jgi:hypothetical protein